LKCHGEPPESSVPLAVRAVHLVGPASRRDLARTVRRVVALTSQPSWCSHVPVCYRNVRAALRELEALHERLEAPGPVSAYGIAQLRALLTDGAGPLYRGSNRDDLAERLGTSKASISRIEAGQQAYTQDFLEACADALRTDPASLLMRNPTDEEAVWSLWDKAKVGDRKMIENIVRSVIKTGT